METNDIVEELNTIANKVDALRCKLINEDRKIKKQQKATSKKQNKAKKDSAVLDELEIIEYKSLASKYGLPTDDEFIADIIKVTKWHELSKEDVEKTFKNIKRANEQEPKKDIKKYTFSCLHKAKQN